MELDIDNLSLKPFKRDNAIDDPYETFIIKIPLENGQKSCQLVSFQKSDEEYDWPGNKYLKQIYPQGFPDEISDEAENIPSSSKHILNRDELSPYKNSTTKHSKKFLGHPNQPALNSHESQNKIFQNNDYRYKSNKFYNETQPHLIIPPEPYPQANNALTYYNYQDRGPSYSSYKPEREFHQPSMDFHQKRGNFHQNSSYPNAQRQNYFPPFRHFSNNYRQGYNGRNFRSRPYRKRPFPSNPRDRQNINTKNKF